MFIQLIYIIHIINFVALNFYFGNFSKKKIIKKHKVTHASRLYPRACIADYQNLRYEYNEHKFRKHFFTKIAVYKT